MSSFTKASNFVHDSLMTGAGIGAMQHMGYGAAGGAAWGAGSAVINGDNTIVGGAVGGATEGAVLGAGFRYASSRYRGGVNHFVNSIYDDTGALKQGLKEIEPGGNFRADMFYNPGSSKQSFWAASKSQVDYANLYKPNFATPAPDPIK